MGKNQLPFRSWCRGFSYRLPADGAVTDPDDSDDFEYLLFRCRQGLTSLLALANSLAATRHLLSMYRRQLNNPATSRTLARLANRLAKVAAALAQLDEAQ